MSDARLTKFDDGDARHDAHRDDEQERRHKARIAALTAEQIESAFNVAEAEYDYDLTVRAQQANLTIIADTMDADAFRAARMERARLDKVHIEKWKVMDAARARWAEVRVKP